MNKILTEWKENKVFSVKNIPETTGAGTSSSVSRGNFTNPTLEAANAKSARERYYSLLREKAQKAADEAVSKAQKNTRFKEIEKTLSKMELELAKAEIYTPEQLPSLLEKKAKLIDERLGVLSEIGLNESDLLPRFVCQKCSDTGFIKNGKACDCYKA